jgi:hypothetical protein
VSSRKKEQHSSHKSTVKNNASMTFISYQKEKQIECCCNLGGNTLENVHFETWPMRLLEKD